MRLSADHHRDRLADVADLAAGKAMLGANELHRRIGLQGRNPLVAHRTRQVLGRQHGVDARQGACCGAIDGADSGVGQRTAHEAGMQCAGQRNIVDVAPAPREQRRVLEPGDARAELPDAHAGEYQPGPFRRKADAEASARPLRWRRWAGLTYRTGSTSSGGSCR
jgi:hypothetical protein